MAREETGAYRGRIIRRANSFIYSSRGGGARTFGDVRNCAARIINVRATAQTPPRRLRRRSSGYVNAYTRPRTFPLYSLPSAHAHTHVVPVRFFRPIPAIVSKPVTPRNTEAPLSIRSKKIRYCPPSRRSLSATLISRRDIGRHYRDQRVFFLFFIPALVRPLRSFFRVASRATFRIRLNHCRRRNNTSPDE